MKKTTLRSLYSFPGFQAFATLKAVPDDPGARIIVLRRRQKKQPAPAVIVKQAATIEPFTRSETLMPAASVSTWSSSTAGYAARGARP
jgi:hypothetical protein